jgi:ribosome biogenesis GTPase
MTGKLPGQPVDGGAGIIYIRTTPKRTSGLRDIALRRTLITSKIGKTDGSEKTGGKASRMLDGIVMRSYGNRFLVFAGGCWYDCQLRKKVKFCADGTTPVAVGDDVKITVISDGQGVVEVVGERRTALTRPEVGRKANPNQQILAANIDVLVIVGSVKEPALKPGLIDRFLIAADMGELHPIIVINKVDLGIDGDEAEAAAIYRSLGYDLFLTSAVDGTGLDDLARYLGQHRSILSGHSGVGKSTLLNKIMPGIDIRTSEISASSGRGVHTTSHFEMYPLLNGGFVIDSPGIKVLGLWQLERTGLDRYYPEMRAFQDNCRFTHCSHIHEPDCAVKEAVERGEVTALRYRNYQQIYHSI